MEVKVQPKRAIIHPQTYALFKGYQAPSYYQSEPAKIEKSNAIISAVEIYFNVPHDKLVSKGRFRDLVIPRQMAMYIIKVKTRLRDDAIAKLFNRDRTTVIYSIQTIEGFLSIGKPEAFIEQLEELMLRLSHL